MTPEQREAALKLARFMNPWTIQIRLRSGSWQEFCHDAPITLQDAEEREEQLKRDNPAATFRVIPWLNMTQWQHVRTQEIDRLHAENVRLREALKDAPHEEDCAYIGSLLRFDKFNGRKLPTVPCNCWKSRAALSGSPDAEAKV